MQTKVSETEFNEIYSRYRKSLLSFSKKITKNDLGAEECVQEVFVSLLKNDFNDKANLSSWLFTVCKNKSLKFLRKEKKYVPVESLENVESLGKLDIDESPNPFENLENEEKYRKMFELVGKLLPRQIKMLKLRYYSDLSYNEIAEKIGTSQQNVGYILSTTLKKIRQEFAKSIDNE